METFPYDLAKQCPMLHLRQLANNNNSQPAFSGGLKGFVYFISVNLQNRKHMLILVIQPYHRAADVED